MPKVVSVLLMVAISAVCSVADASDNPRFTFAKIKSQTEHAKSAKLIVARKLPIESLVFSSNDPAEGCVVYLRSDLVRTVSSDTLAVLMAHEIAHCELGHHARARVSVTESEAQRLAWMLEYEADALIVRLTRRLGIDARLEFAELMSIFPDGPDHPSGKARIQALGGGERVYPQAHASTTPVTANAAGVAP